MRTDRSILVLLFIHQNLSLFLLMSVIFIFRNPQSFTVSDDMLMCDLVIVIRLEIFPIIDVDM